MGDNFATSFFLLTLLLNGYGEITNYDMNDLQINSPNKIPPLVNKDDQFYKNCCLKYSDNFDGIYRDRNNFNEYKIKRFRNCFREFVNFSKHNLNNKHYFPGNSSSGLMEINNCYKYYKLRSDHPGHWLNKTSTESNFMNDIKMNVPSLAQNRRIRRRAISDDGKGIQRSVRTYLSAPFERGGRSQEFINNIKYEHLTKGRLDGGEKFTGEIKRKCQLNGKYDDESSMSVR